MKIKNKDGKSVNVKLPKAFKNKWIKALRSGEYGQCTGELQSDTGSNNYCCLGVACRIQHPKMNLLGIGSISKDNFKRIESIKIPSLLKEYKGDDNAVVAKLIFFNDDKKWSFKKIASWIEKNL